MKTITLLFTCLLIQSSLGAKVAFRLDDIQDFFVNNCQMALLDLFEENNTPITIGIIGGPNRFGLDPTLLSRIRSAITTSGWEVEVASHGNQHEDFTLLQKAVMLSRLNESNNNVRGLLGLSKIYTFLPPFNAFNADLVDVVKTLGFTHMSSQNQLDTVRPYPVTGQTFYRFPSGAATSNSATTYIGIPAQATMDQCDDQFASDGFCVVLVHPMEFCERDDTGNYTNVVNTTQLEQMRELIQLVQDGGHTIVPIRRLDNESTIVNVTVPEIPPAQVGISFILTQAQDYFRVPGVTRIMDTFAANNVPITVGFISSIIGQDASFTTYLRTYTNPHEYAVFSWNMEDYTTLTLTDQIYLLNRSRSALELFLQTTPKTFIPYNGLFNENTISALKQNGYTHLSASASIDTGDNSNPTQNLWRFPSSMNANFKLDSPEQILLNLRFQAQRNRAVVITLNPADYMSSETAVDTNTISQLNTLLQSLTTSGYKTSPIQTLQTVFPLSTTGVSVPSTTGTGLNGTTTGSVASSSSSPATSQSSTIASSTQSTTRASSSMQTSAGTTRSSTQPSTSVQTSETTVPIIPESNASVVAILSVLMVTLVANLL